MAKIVNTRIQLKHDTLANWNSSNIALKYGEAAVAFVDTATIDAKGNIIHVPTALLKFGDSTGTKTFKDLPFASALAADVYAWAKAKDVERNGKVLQFKAADGTVTHSVSFDYLTDADVNTLLANYYTKTEIDDELDTIKQSITDLDVSTIVGRVEALETVTETTLPGQINAVDAKFANYTTTTDLNIALNAKADKTKVAEDIAAAIEPLATTEALNGVKATAEAAQTAQQVSDAIDAKITAQNLGQYTTEQEVKDIVDGVIAGAADDETYNSLTKLVDYIDTHGGEAAEMAQAIEALESKVDVEKVSTAIADADIALHTVISKEIDDDVAAAIDAEVERANGAYDVKDAAATAKAEAIAEAKLETEKQIEALNIDQYAKTETLGDLATKDSITASLVDDFATEVAKVKVAAAIAADSATKATQDGDGNVISTTYRKVADKITSDDLSDEVWIFDCGTSTTVI